MEEQWQVKLGPCLILPHPTRMGVLLVTNTEVMSGEMEQHPKVPLTKELVEKVIARHGNEFLSLIANFQKFILGMVTLGQPDEPGYKASVERCYELNRLQRLSLLKYLANEIVMRAWVMASVPEAYPSQDAFDKALGLKQ